MIFVNANIKYFTLNVPKRSMALRLCTAKM